MQSVAGCTNSGLFVRHPERPVAGLCDENTRAENIFICPIHKAQHWVANQIILILSVWHSCRVRLFAPGVPQALPD